MQGNLLLDDIETVADKKNRKGVDGHCSFGLTKAGKYHPLHHTEDRNNNTEHSGMNGVCAWKDWFFNPVLTRVRNVSENNEKINIKMNFKQIYEMREI